MSKKEIIKIEDLKTLTAEQLAEFAIECAESVRPEPRSSLWQNATLALCNARDVVSGDKEPSGVIKVAKETAKAASNTSDPQDECRLRAAQWVALTTASAKTNPDITRTRDSALTASRFALRTTLDPKWCTFHFEPILENPEMDSTALEAETAKQWDILENIKSK